MYIDAAGRTHVGGRTHNEDSFCVNHELGLFAVADGMGGHSSGEVASRLAIDALRGYFIAAQRVRYDVKFSEGYDSARAFGENVLDAGVQRANAAVHQMQSNPVHAGMGTTMASLWFDESSTYVAHVGDSRVYRYRGGKLEALTRDHSLVNEMLDRGLIEHVDALEGRYANVITRAVGMHEKVSVDTARTEPMDRDVYVLCSDGLSNPIGNAGIERVLAKGGDADRLACRLVEAALAAEGSDNITAVVVRFQR